MKKHLFPSALLLYALSCLLLVVLSFMLALAYPLLHGEWAIVVACFKADKIIFPKYYMLNVVVIGSFAAILLLYFLWRPFLRLYERLLYYPAKQKKFLMVLILALPLVLLGILEIGLRCAGIGDTRFERNGWTYTSAYSPPKKGGWLYSVKPLTCIEGSSAGEFSYHYKINSDGFPDHQWQLIKKRPRIACIGDSFTEGVGGPQDSSYPALLQKLMPNVEVMDFGVAGSDPVFEVEVLKQKVIQYNPDVITLALNGSDITDIMTRGGFERFRSDHTVQYRSGPRWESFYESCYLMRLWAVKFGHVGTATLLTPKQSEKERQRALMILEGALDTASAICTTHHTRLIFIFHPTETELKLGTLELQKVLDYAQSKNYETLNLTASFQSQPEELFWPLDSHNNSKGYLIFAKKLNEQINTKPY